MKKSFIAALVIAAVLAPVAGASAAPISIQPLNGCCVGKR